MADLDNLIAELARVIAGLPELARVEALNRARAALHEVSPFASQPVDCVFWVRAEKVVANDYNPNSVAPPEMRLLERSIEADGYTQPIVAHDTGEQVVVVDGFHRHRVGKECEAVRQQVRGYLPIVRIRAGQADDASRRASTVRHNRARGTHGVGPMTELVLYLAKRGWDDGRIGKELGMDPDEVLRFRQVGGLAEVFADQEFSEAWDLEIEPDDPIDEQGMSIVPT